MDSSIVKDCIYILNYNRITYTEYYSPNSIYIILNKGRIMFFYAPHLELQNHRFAEYRSILKRFTVLIKLCIHR